MQNNINKMDLKIDERTFIKLDQTVQDSTADFRITKKLLMNMGLMFLFDELTFTEIKSEIREYPKATNTKRIVFGLINPRLTEQVNTIATRNEKHILIEIGLNRLFKKMEVKPFHELVSKYILIGGSL